MQSEELSKNCGNELSVGMSAVPEHIPQIFPVGSPKLQLWFVHKPVVLIPVCSVFYWKVSECNYAKIGEFQSATMTKSDSFRVQP